jgi:hypothetical protein
MGDTIIVELGQDVSAAQGAATHQTESKESWAMSGLVSTLIAGLLMGSGGGLHTYRPAVDPSDTREQAMSSGLLQAEPSRNSSHGRGLRFRKANYLQA